MAEVESASHSAPRWHLAVLLGAVALVLLAAFPYFEQIRNANEIPRLVQAMSVVEQGEWAIDGASQRGIPLGPDVARSPVDGRIYPNKPPGASLVGALGYVLARIGSEPPTLREFTWWARLLAGTIPVLIIIGLAWGRLRPLYPPSVCAAAILLWVFGTPMFSYARLYYGHALAACLVYVGVILIERGTSERRPWELVAGSAVASLAITVEYGAAFAGIPIAIMLVWPVIGPGRRDPVERGLALRQAGIALASALVPVLLLARYQRVVFGSAFSTGYHHAADPGFAKLHAQGLLGLGLPTWDNIVTQLLSVNTGLLVWTPLVIPAVLGLLRLVRKRTTQTRAARLQLGVFVVILVMGLGLSFQGGWRVGPRYLVVAMPMLILGLADFMDRWRDDPRSVLNAAMFGLLGFAAIWSLLANVLAATLWPHIDPTNISEPFGAVLLPLWEHGYGPYGIPSMARAGLILTCATPVVLGLGSLVWAVGFVRPQAVLLPLLLGFAGGAVTLLLIVPRSVIANPRTERNLKYIERVYEPRVESGTRMPAESRVLELPAESRVLERPPGPGGG